MFTNELYWNYVNDVMTQVNEAIRKKEEYEYTKVDPMRILTESLWSARVSEELFESYDIDAWKVKYRVDSLVFRRLFDKIEDEDAIQEAENKLGACYQIVRRIYECANLKPEYQPSLSIDLLEKSLEESEQAVDEILNAFLVDRYYAATPDQRSKIYGSRMVNLVEEYVNNGVDKNDAMTYAIKKLLVEDLIDHLAFPSGALLRIKTLTEDDNYKRIFDHAKLISLLEKYGELRGELGSLFCKYI